MCRVGHKHLCPCDIAAAHVVRAYHHKPGQLTVRPGIRIEGELRHSANLRESPFKVIICLKRTLHGLCGLIGMQTVESRHRGNLLVDFGIVLHRA